MARVLTEETYQRMMRVIARVESMPISAGLDPNQTGSIPPNWPPFTAYLGKLTAASSKGSTGTLLVYKGDPGSETIISSSQTIGFYNHFGNVSSGLWGVTVVIGNSHYLVVAESTC